MAHFNKRHYQFIAQTIQTVHLAMLRNDNATASDAIALLRSELATNFAVDNPLFKKDLFLQACKPGANVRARKVA